MNRAPYINKLIYENAATANHYLQHIDQKLDYTFSVFCFQDLDIQDTLFYSARLEDGSPLPDWIQFNNKVLQFTGTPRGTDLYETCASQQIKYENFSAENQTTAQAKVVFCIFSVMVFASDGRRNASQPFMLEIYNKEPYINLDTRTYFGPENVINIHCGTSFTVSFGSRLMLDPDKCDKLKY